MPASVSTGQSRSSAIAAAISVPSDTRGAMRFAAKAAA
jgi:hypothetical protein